MTEMTIEQKAQALFSNLEVHNERVVVAREFDSGYFTKLFDDVHVQKLAQIAFAGANREKFADFLEDIYKNGAIHAWENVPVDHAAHGLRAELPLNFLKVLNPQKFGKTHRPIMGWETVARSDEKRTAFAANILAKLSADERLYERAMLAGFRYDRWKDSVIELIARDHSLGFFNLHNELIESQPTHSLIRFGEPNKRFGNACHQAAPEDISIGDNRYRLEVEGSYVKIINALCDRARDIGVNAWKNEGAAQVAEAAVNHQNQFVSIYRGTSRTLFGTAWIEGSERWKPNTIAYYDEMCVNERDSLRDVREAVQMYVSSISHNNGYSGVVHDPDELVKLNDQRLAERK